MTAAWRVPTDGERAVAEHFCNVRFGGSLSHAASFQASVAAQLDQGRITDAMSFHMCRIVARFQPEKFLPAVQQLARDELDRLSGQQAMDL